MTDRSDAIPLAADEPRCDPTKPDRAASRCARRLAALPTRGAAIGDYSIAPPGCCALCSGYVDVSALRKAATPAPRPVRPAVRGM